MSDDERDDVHDDVHRQDGESDTVPPDAVGGHQQETDVRDTQPGNRDTGGYPGMGVSSERVGVAGPGQTGTEGVRNTDDERAAVAATEGLDDEEATTTPEGETVVREQRPGLKETEPDPVGNRGHHEKHNPGHTHG